MEKGNGRQQDKGVVYVARTQRTLHGGLWNEFAGERRFVILTTAPNESVKDVYDRMPVVLPLEQVRPWIAVIAWRFSSKNTFRLYFGTNTM